MRSNKRLYLASAITLALVSAAPVSAAVNANPIGFLTQAQSGDREAIAIGYLESQRSKLGLTALDIADMDLRDDYQSKHSGIRHLYWHQRHQGIPVYNGILAINVARDGSIINLNNGFVSDLAAKINATEPAIDAVSAISAAADELGLGNRMALLLLREEGGPSRKATYSNGGISADDIPVQLMYQPTADGAVRLTWEMVIRETSGENWWSLRVDADTGEIISRANFIAHLNESATKGGGDAQYRVFPFPFESPDETPQVLVSDPHDVIASPFGWHDTNGVAGPEFTDTSGNNVVAQEDFDGNNSGGTRPSSTGTNPQVFDFPFNPANDPEVGNNLNAAIVNLFYWNNIMHDVSYQYGFDEAAGNFQTNNYGNGGAGNDAVQADALDQMTGGPNGPQSGNANFGTPPDGQRPRMQMFRFNYPFSRQVTVNTPASIAGSYTARPSNNGGTAVLTADLALVQDGTAPTADGCQAVINDLTGKIGVIVWNQGACNSSVFVANAAAAGAIGVVIVDNVTPLITNFGGSATIPSVSVSSDDGQLFVTTLGSASVNVTLEDNTTGPADRDSDLDHGIISHEYGHGISNRLTGGPSAASCLQNGEQGGEGWSDFWALVLHAKSTDTANTPRHVGTYASFRDRATGPGIRNFPYSPDPAVSPQTYANVGSTNAPHGIGEIWAGALWNVYWNLVDIYGFDADLYTGTGGNNLLIQLVMDGMKLQPCSPTMVAARDAILLADLNNNGGANQCAIWNGFAAKGMGVNASAGGGGAGDEIENFEVPAVCGLGTIFSDGFE